MTTRRTKSSEGGLITIHCDSDSCHKNFEATALDFSDAKHEAREHGWTSSQFTGVWKDHCPACSQKLGG